MKEESKNILKKGVSLLKNLHFKPENIMVTGSIALDAYGLLPENRIPHDIDFVIKMDNQTWRNLKLLEAINNIDSQVKNKDYESEARKKTIFFNVNGLIINIWQYDGNDWSGIKDSETGVYVATPDHIISAKKKYGRPKDFKDINEIIKTVL